VVRGKDTLNLTCHVLNFVYFSVNLFQDDTTASSNPAYGATPISINLNGNVGVTGLNLTQYQRELTVKNNPVADQLQVSAPFTGNVEWTIFNNAGARVYNQIASSLLTVQVSNLQSGIYMIKAVNKATVENGIVKFIKK